MDKIDNSRDQQEISSKTGQSETYARMSRRLDFHLREAMAGIKSARNLDELTSAISGPIIRDPSDDR